MGLLKRINYPLLTVLWALLILLLTLSPGNTLPQGFWSWDKAGHTVIFTFLSFLMSNSFQRSPSNRLKRSAILFAFVVSAFYGLFLETVQEFMPGRAFEWLDLVANTGGCILGVGFAKIHTK